ncbi:MAG: hypothetical protein ABFR05_10240 [Bacteroidota bacterium]
MKTKLLFGFLFFLHISFAQEIKTEFIAETPLKADKFIGIDVLDNIYYIQNNILYKKNTSETLVYSNVKLGKITSVNIQNPFKIILLYKDYNSVIVLDNKLNELTQAITFSNTNISLVSYASENNLWIYSKDNNTLQLFDYQNETINLTTQPLSFYHENFMANDLFSSNDNVWLFNQKGVLQFNQYASFIEFHNIKNVELIFPFKKGFVYIRNDELLFFDNGVSSLISINFPKGKNEIYFNKGKIYIFHNGILFQYRIL